MSTRGLLCQSELLVDMFSFLLLPTPRFRLMMLPWKSERWEACSLPEMRRALGSQPIPLREEAAPVVKDWMDVHNHAYNSV